jgi:hypothetical protein
MDEWRFYIGEGIPIPLRAHLSRSPAWAPKRTRNGFWSSWTSLPVARGLAGNTLLRRPPSDTVSPGQ